MAKILVIDDEQVIRENLVELLEMEGYEVFSAEDGCKGLELAIQCLPDLILCDVVMGCLDGFQVLESLQENPTTQHIPLAFLSAQADKTSIDKGVALGARYITKPFYVEDMLALVEIILEENREQQNRSGITN